MLKVEIYLMFMVYGILVNNFDEVTSRIFWHDVYFQKWIIKIETRGQKQPHLLFPTQTISVRNILMPHIPDSLQKRRANNHNNCSFVTLCKAYIIGFYSYKSTDISCYSCVRNDYFYCSNCMYQIWWIVFRHTYMWHIMKYLYVLLFGWLYYYHHCHQDD